MVSQAFLLALVVRSLALVLPQTFFQPDEFYQAFEPAHHLVFGYGHITWEWKDLPLETSSGGLWDDVVAGGRMRSWLWPSVFAVIYKALQVFRVDETFLLTLASRIIGVLVAATTDYATSRLASKLLGPGAAAGAMFLSLTSLFNAHLLPRALSTSPETMLVTLALVYFPYPKAVAPKGIIVGKKELVASQSMKDVQHATDKELAKAKEDAATVIRIEGVEDLDYAVMDRMPPFLHESKPMSDSLVSSVLFASLAICVRPTTLPLWAYLGVDLLVRESRTKGFYQVVTTLLTAFSTGLGVLAASTGIDYAITGRLYLPILTFLHQNVFLNISSFYGSTGPFYHLVQSLPIMLFPIWFWWAQGFVAALLPSSLLPTRLATLDTPPGLRLLGRALAFTIFTLSWSPHSEWRFLHPLLPSLLLFALPALFRNYVPLMPGCYRIFRSIRQYTRIAKVPYYLCLAAPILPFLYLNIWHGAAQVQVMDVLRRGQLGNVTGLVVLMPCHSTPWMSHLHRDVPGWFLTCEPPLGKGAFDHVTQQQLFYRNPVSYLQTVFPFPPAPLEESTKRLSVGGVPSHVVLFGELLGRDEEVQGRIISVHTALDELGYGEVWNAWDGFDLLQDEAERRGGVRVWRLQQ